MTKRSIARSVKRRWSGGNRSPARIGLRSGVAPGIPSATAGSTVNCQMSGVDPFAQLGTDPLSAELDRLDFGKILPNEFVFWFDGLPKGQLAV